MRATMWIMSGGRVEVADDALILVVDDDARLRDLLSRYLQENGFRVSTAESAADARDRLRVFQPDLIVMDVMMPGETGLELTEVLRRDNAMTPILLLTARGAPEDRIAGFEAGADDYLPKPFDPRELLLRIRALLRRAAPPIAPVEAPAGPLALGRRLVLGRVGDYRCGSILGLRFFPSVHLSPMPSVDFWSVWRWRILRGTLSCRLHGACSL